MISFKCWESVLDVVRERWPQCGTSSEESACNAGGTGSIPGSGRSPGGEYGNPLQYSCLGNLLDSGAWWATVHGVPKSQIWLSNWVYVHTHTHTHQWEMKCAEDGERQHEWWMQVAPKRSKRQRNASSSRASTKKHSPADVMSHWDPWQILNNCQICAISNYWVHRNLLPQNIGNTVEE